MVMIRVRIHHINIYRIGIKLNDHECKDDMILVPANQRFPRILLSRSDIERRLKSPEIKDFVQFSADFERGLAGDGSAHELAVAEL